MYDLLIKNGRIVDGTGNPWFKADVSVKDGKISRVGRIKDPAERTIDASDLIVSPGWVDFHSHSDWSLIKYPQADSDLIQGATLVVTGNCGSSAAPLKGVAEERAASRARNMGINLDWNTFEDYLMRLERQGISMNVASMVGHSTLRSCVMGDAERPAKGSEIDEMKTLLLESIAQGAFGLSTGLVYWPGCWSDTNELIELSKVLAEHGGLYVSHIRGERETNIEATKEIIEIGEKAGIPVHISHMQSKYPEYGNAEAKMKLMYEARRRGIDIACDTEAFPWIGYPASSPLPPWPFKEDYPAFVSMLSEPKTRARLKREMAEIDPQDPLGRTGDGGIYQKRTWDRVWVYECKSNPEVEGKSVDTIAFERKVEPEDALFDLIIAEKGKGPKVFVSHIEDDHRLTAPNPLCIFPSTDGSVVELTKMPPRYFQYHPEWLGMFPRVLSRYVKEEGLMTAEDAIRRMTSFCCQRLGIRDRGLVMGGMWADLTIFDLETIQVRGDYSNPQQKPIGIEYVIVNGEIVVEQGRYSGAQAGKVLRHDTR